MYDILKTLPKISQRSVHPRTTVFFFFRGKKHKTAEAVEVLQRTFLFEPTWRPKWCQLSGVQTRISKHRPILRWLAYHWNMLKTGWIQQFPKKTVFQLDSRARKNQHLEYCISHVPVTVHHKNHQFIITLYLQRSWRAGRQKHPRGNFKKLIS